MLQIEQFWYCLYGHELMHEFDPIMNKVNNEQNFIEMYTLITRLLEQEP